MPKEKRRQATPMVGDIALPSAPTARSQGARPSLLDPYKRISSTIKAASEKVIAAQGARPSTKVKK